MANGELQQTYLPTDPDDIDSVHSELSSPNRNKSPSLFGSPPSPKCSRLDGPRNLLQEYYDGRVRRHNEPPRSLGNSYNYDDLPRWEREEESGSSVLASETPSSLSSLRHTPGSSISRVSSSGRSSSSSRSAGKTSSSGSSSSHVTSKFQLKRRGVTIDFTDDELTTSNLLP